MQQAQDDDAENPFSVQLTGRHIERLNSDELTLAQTRQYILTRGFMQERSDEPMG